MSGPTTAVYESAGFAAAGGALVGVSAVVLAARAIREAQAMHAEYGEVHQRMLEREKERFEQRKQLRVAAQNRIASLHGQAGRLQARLARLQALLAEQAEQTEASGAEQAIALPASQDEAVWLACIARLEAAIAGIEERLRASRQDAVLALAVGIEEQPDAGRILAAYAQRQALGSLLGAEQRAHYAALARTLVSRLEQADGEALPVHIESLMREMLQARDEQRAEALATELRLEIQNANRRREQLREDAAFAEQLLAEFGDDLPESLRDALAPVAAGVALLDEPTRAAAEQARIDLRAARKLEEEEAIALVLEQSLRDLGYEVEDIAQTLFVSGGMVHFRKAAWDNYHVRMRVNTDEKSVNFNVVRAHGSGDEAADKRLDYMAEDRWCSEFPALLKTLEARGVKLNVTRLLQAGEVPVQVVDASTLPEARREEERRPEAALKQRQL